MKFKFKNIGTIKETTLVLRPLTVILGPNNTSKTYLAYCVHGLLKSLADRRAYLYIADFATGSAKIEIDPAKVVTRAMKRSVAASKLASGAFTHRLTEYFQDTHGSLFQDASLAVDIEEKDIQDALKRMSAVGSSRLIHRDKEIVVNHVRAGSLAAREKVFEAVVESLLRNLSRPTLTLPAERNAFVITYKMLSARRYRVLRDQVRARPTRGSEADEERQMSLLREQGDIRYPEPIEDFLDFLTDVELDAGGPPRKNQEFIKLASLIEQRIQGGHRTSYEATRLGGRELTVEVSEDVRLDLYNASSSIKQIAPLLLYLRYRAAPNQTLIIDEPEMNLHPEGQAKLLEALGMLANLGVRVLLTTHSPYFMAHLNNLIAADRASSARRARQAENLYLGEPAAFLAPDNVSAYEMRPEGLTSLSDPEYGIRWDTLSDVSSELQRRYFAIVEEPQDRERKK